MELVIKSKNYGLPIFMPDATHASIKGLDSVDLANTGVRGVVVNTYHLLTDGIVDIVNKAGGIKKFMNFEGLVITDSGGFQAMSLVRKDKKNGQILDVGVHFKNPASGAGLFLNPKTCVETQIKLGSDVIMVLDDCTDPMEPESEQENSVKRTVTWAKQCKEEFIRLTKTISSAEKPKIFAIIQGGNSKKLRKECADGLLSIGFDGYAYGGWPMSHGKLLADILDYTCDLMPNGLPKYAMGVGKPQDIANCYKMGYNMFDCVIPTRDARHGRLYVHKNGAVDSINLGNEKFKEDFTAIEIGCTCFTCQNYSKSYLRHLYKIGEPVFYKLSTIHNLQTYITVFSAL